MCDCFSETLTKERNRMSWKSQKLGSFVVVVLSSLVACLYSFPVGLVRNVEGALPAMRPSCDEVIHTMKKYGRHGVMTTTIKDSLFRELGEPDLPIKDENGYKYCWRCSKPCPEGQKQDAETACIFMDFDWRVTGYGTPGCKPIAKSLREKADRGDTMAQIDLGDLYETGKGVRQDYREAVSWYRKAAESGDSYGQYRLGLMYEAGKGVAHDSQEALRWYRMAAKQNNGSALERLRALAATSDGKKETRKPDGGSRPITPDQARDRRRPAQTSGDICESAGMLLDRLAVGIAEDDKDGRIDMGNTKEVTNGQAISLKWRDDMRKISKVLHNQYEIAKIDSLSDAAFQIEQAVRLYIKQKKEKERTHSDDCDSLNNTLDKFKREVARFNDLCHPIIIPTEMTYPMKPCLSKPKVLNCEEMMGMVNKSQRWGNSPDMYIDNISAGAVQGKFGPPSCTQPSGRICWKCRKQNGSISYFTVTPGHAAVGLSNCNCQ